MNIDNSLTELNNYTDLLTEYTNVLRERAGDNMLQYFSQMRDIPLEEVIKSDIFYPLTARRLRPLRWEMNCVCYLLDRAS